MKVEIPERAPVMVLPGATLFPHALLPLYIFEPRYRQMLADVLESHRVFCVALIKPDVEEAIEPEDFYQVGTVGLVRACVTNADGSSNLILQGLARVRFKSISEDHAYREAELELICTDPVPREQEAGLRRGLQAMIEELERAGLQMPKQIQEYLRHPCSLELLIDLITYNFLTDPILRQRLLEECDLAQRLHLLRRYLTGQIA